ncbi:Bromo domain-containing protein [Psidium guajava]|nr:Bromo domain-containing protein [Psidium guajava]
MGKGSSETKKKKKGRPSLLDIQKRLLKQQKSQASSPYQNPNGAHGDPPPNPSRRSTGRNPGRDGPYPSSDWVSAGDDDDDDDDERAEKKHRLLLGLDSNLSANSSGLCGSDSNASADNHEAALVTRRIGFGSDYPTEKVSKVTDTRNGSLVESGPTTPLPDKKLLVFILDRLQKKDSYGVFSEPVDPEELPDYHDIIKNPMDFGTVKKKLDEGAYINLEQFEKDIFLICSNAMQYNAPDTVFFRQARAMQDIAKKDFENLRQDSDSEPEQPKVVRRGRPPGRGLKKLLDKPSVNGVCREGSSDATLANVDNSCWSNTYNLRVHNPGPSDSIGNATHRTPYTEGQPSWFSDLENEFPVSVWKAVQKNGKKLSPSEENKRDTYKQQFTSRLEKSGSFDGELKHLSAVGVYLNHGYARSLARFAADLGPAVWRIASKKIENVLPNGVQFGPGWVGEDDRHLGRLKSCISSGHPCEDLPMTAAVKSSSNSSGRSPQSAEDMETLRRLNSQSKFINAGDLKPLDDTPATSFTGEINMVTQPMPAMVAAHTYEAPATVEGQRVVSSNYATAHPTPGNVLQSTTAELSGSTGTSQPFNPFRSRAASEEQWWNRQGVPMERKQDVVPIVLYQNNGFQLQGSLNSNLQLGSPRQPDLALQL